MTTQLQAFSKEELITIVSNSKTYSEALRQLGYGGSSNYNYHIKDIAQKYNIDISNIEKKDINRQKWNLGWQYLAEKNEYESNKIERSFSSIVCGALFHPLDWIFFFNQSA